MKTHHPVYSRGFTLFEIQIAVSLLLLIVMLGYSSLYLAGRSWHTSESSSADIERKRIISQFLRRQIAQSIPLVLSTDNQQRLLFEGKSDSLEFIGLLPGNHNNGRFHIINIQHQNRRLIVTYRPLHTSDSRVVMNTDVIYETLLTDISDIEFSYYGRHDKHALRGWKSSWSGLNLPPELVRLQVKPLDSAPWPDLIVPHHASVRPDHPEFIIYANTARYR